MSLSSQSRQDAERILGHTFVNAQLLVESLTHSSASNDRGSSNERLEFLGDAVLDLAICRMLFERFPEHQEGDLTKMKSAIVSRRTCAAVAIETGLAELLMVGKGITGRVDMPRSLAAAVYESVVAALYLDGGTEVAERFIFRTMQPHVELIVSSLHAHNYKALLQQHAQKVHASTPNYELLDEQGPDHSKCFEVCVNIDGRRFESAWGPSKKTAEQKAAVKALRAMDLFDDTEAGDALGVLDALAPAE